MRDNEAWLRALHSGGEQRDAALADLHALLLRALPQGLARLLSPKNPEFESFIEDTAQETLLRTLAGLDSFEGRSQFTTWTYKIAVRVALNELRRRRWRDVSLEGLESDDGDNKPSHHFASPEPGPEMIVERADILQHVQQIMKEELTERQRAAMHAINMQGVPMEEVARRMGTNRNTFINFCTMDVYASNIVWSVKACIQRNCWKCLDCSKEVESHTHKQQGNYYEIYF